jgi:hypothetical protein
MLVSMRAHAWESDSKSSEYADSLEIDCEESCLVSSIVGDDEKVIPFEAAIIQTEVSHLF